jgi:NodT family efflux transporter outer membrane factor (OMF) lipoprotein
MPEAYFIPQEESQGETTPLWWESFNNTDLNLFMDQVFSNNLDLKQVVARMQQAQSLYQQSKALSLPWLNLEGSGGRTKQRTFLGSATDDTYQASLVAGYEIDLWGKISSQQEAAFLRLKASEAEIRSLFITLSAQVAETWFRLSELQEQIKLTDEIILSRKDSLTRIERRYKAGLISSLDVYQARQSLSNARTRLPKFTYDLKTTEHALAVLAGNWPGQIISDSTWQLPDITTSFPAGLPAELLKNRPDVYAAYLQLQAADYEIASAVADRFPTFSLTGAYGGSSNELSNLLNSSNIFWNMLLNISQTIFDGDRKKQEVERKKYIFEERLAAWHSILLKAFQEVADALAAEEDAKRSLELQQELKTAALNTLRVAEDQYRQGLVDYLNVLTAQTAYNESQRDVVTARRNRIAARISLARAVGGKWMDSKMRNYQLEITN